MDSTSDVLLDKLTSWWRWYNAGDIDRVVSLFCEEARLMPNNHDMLIGREAIRAHLVKVRTNASPRMECRMLEAEQLAPDSAFTSTEGCNLDLDGKPMAKFTSIMLWKKIDNDWQIYRDIFNACAPLSQDVK